MVLLWSKQFFVFDWDVCCDQTKSLFWLEGLLWWETSGTKGNTLLPPPPNTYKGRELRTQKVPPQPSKPLPSLWSSPLLIIPLLNCSVTALPPLKHSAFATTSLTLHCQQTMPAINWKLRPAFQFSILATLGKLPQINWDNNQPPQHPYQLFNIFWAPTLGPDSECWGTIGDLHELTPDSLKKCWGTGIGCKPLKELLAILDDVMWVLLSTTPFPNLELSW